MLTIGRSEAKRPGTVEATAQGAEPGAAPSPSSAEPRGTFIGREHQLAVARQALEDARAGRGRVVLFSGPPGIGKTRLVEEIGAGATGVAVHWGRCHEEIGSPAYWPWTQIVRARVRDSPADFLRDDLALGAGEIARVVPELHDRLRDIPSPPRLEPEQERFRFFDSVTTFFKNAARRRPLLLIFDDLHWADPSSLSLLRFLGREIDDARLLVVGTYRQEEVEQGRPLEYALAELLRTPRSERIVLAGLSLADTGKLIECTAGQKPSQALAERIAAQTDGNPLFIAEVVRMLLAERCLEHPTPEAASVPPGVRAVIERRVAPLSTECRELLAIAAVAGWQWSLAVLAVASGVPATRVLEVLDEAVAARVLIELPVPAGAYRFAHALLRDALYEQLPARRRLEMHRLVGEAWESVPATRDERAAALAHHFHAAAPLGDIDKAVRCLRAAAEWAMSQLGFDEAATHYERALHLLELQPGADDRAHVELLLGLGDARWKAGDADGARVVLEQGAALGRQIRAPDLLARAVLGMFAGWVPLTPLRHGLRSRLLEEARAALGDVESAERAMVTAHLGLELCDAVESRGRAIELCDEAAQMARRVGDQRTLAHVLIVLDTVKRHVHGPDNIDERGPITEESLWLAEQAGDQFLLVAALRRRIVNLFDEGDIRSADDLLAAHAHAAGELRHPSAQLYVALWSAMRALLDGRFDEVEPSALEMLQLAGRAGESAESAAAAGNFGALMLALRYDQGRVAELELPTAALVQEGRNLPVWRCALAFIYAEMGRTEAARTEFEVLARDDFTGVPKDWLWLGCMWLLSEVCAHLCDQARAAVLFRMLDPYGKRPVVIGAAHVCAGSAAHNLGVLAATMHHWDQATRHFEYALAMNTRMRARPRVAHTQFRLAAVLARGGTDGQTTRAKELAATAVETAEQFGMTVLRARALGLLREIQAADPIATNIAGASAARADTGQPSSRTTFRAEGDFWTITHGGVTIRLKHARGLLFLARLLRDPGREIPATEVLAGAGRSGAAPFAPSFPSARPNLGDAGELLDAGARAAYTERLGELREALNEAERFNDLGRSERLREELDFLTRELSRAVGLGGRGRVAGSHAERARVNVTRAISAALKKIAAHHPTLGAHFARTIRTGTFCSYAPDPRAPIEWEV